jgi:hypothetical protein
MRMLELDSSLDRIQYLQNQTTNKWVIQNATSSILQQCQNSHYIVLIQKITAETRQLQNILKNKR